MRWILVRHGETEWNRGRMIQGHTDIPLSPSGRVQSTALQARLRNVKYDVAWSSDLKRAMETAALALKGREPACLPTPRLRELNFGAWEGKTWEAVTAEDPEGAAQWFTVDPNYQAPEGETINQLMDRAQVFLDEAGAEAAAAAAETVLVVAHGGTIRALTVLLANLIRWEFASLATPDPASVSIVHEDGAGGVIELWNDTSHYRGMT